MSWIIILIQILLKAPEIYNLIKEIIDMIKGIRDKKTRKDYEQKLKVVIKERLEGSRGIQQTVDKLQDLKKEVEALIN